MTSSRILGFVCLGMAVVSGAWSIRQLRAEDGRSTAERLLGPVADLAAAAQWVRVDSAWADGRVDVYDARADFALRLAPGDPNGWIYYAHNLVYDRASPAREPDRAARERWVRAGLDVLAEGEKRSRSPGRLAFQTAIVYLSMAQMDDEERPLSITRARAWESAAEAFERAALAGEPLAAEAAEGARREMNAWASG